ncbi:hypothetical protein E7V67_023385 [[Empedobacter] haloabium]|uniref:Uncharacterized protein n=1 Tax=[Empedobacter] haloabium TaxID=592317 RepID=A0ABZ1UK88_9BURK
MRALERSTSSELQKQFNNVSLEGYKQTLTAAHDHVVKSKEAFQQDDNLHVSSAATMLDRTLCLASNFNQAGSLLSSVAEENNHAGHYIRSFDHDLLISNKSDQRPVTNLVARPKGDAKALAANVGRIPNVPTLELSRVKGRLTAEPLQRRPKASSAANAELYDASLAYRTALSDHVAKQLDGAKRIKVDVYNAYPAVMVHFDARSLLQGFRSGADLSTPAASFNEFLMSHYLGIVNAEAAKMGLDTATVERSSFGHLTPSVAATGESFRINLGMMPPAYAEAHIKALALLDQELDSFATSLTQNHGVDRNKFAGSVHSGDLQRDQNILQLAFTKVESQGKTLMTSATRTLKARNAVDAASFRQHTGPAAANPIGATLSTLFSYVTVAEDGKVSTRAPEATYTMPRADAPAAAATAAPGDAAQPLAASYRNYLDKFSSQLATVAQAGTNPTTSKHIRALAQTLTSKNPDIATALDVANQLLMVHTLDTMKAKAAAVKDNGDNSASHVDGDAMDVDKAEYDLGHGSDSEIEDDASIEGHAIRGNKIITHNGMRSLLGATDSARALLFAGRGDVQIAYEHPYYETQNAIKKTRIRVEENKDKNSEAKIVIKDINACITDGEAKTSAPLAEAFPDARAWIIDTTSATTDQMRSIYQQFTKADNAELLYLASSGLKNEQAGADQNNYGTLRVFAKAGDGEASKQRVGEVLGAIAGTDRGLAQFSHEHRRTMKAMGLVPTNQSIVMPVRSDVVMAEAPFGTS